MSLPIKRNASNHLTLGLAVCLAVVGMVVLGMMPRSYAEEGPVLFWPAPPAEIKIIYKKTITSPGDLGIRPSFFGRIVNFVVGETKDALVRPIAVAVGPDQTLYVCDPETQ